MAGKHRTRALCSVAGLAALAAVFAPAQANAAPGDLFRAFAGDGIASYRQDPGLPTEFQDVAAAPGGKIVAAGEALIPNPGTGLEVDSTAVLARYDSTGALDPTFGSGGTVTLPLGSPDNPCASANPCRQQAAVQRDGSIILALGDRVGPSGFGANRTRVYRYLPDGTPDGSFGVGGALTLPHFTLIAMDVEASGDILVGGYSRHPSVARVLPGGTLDPSFGDGGVAAAAGRHHSIAAVTADGKGRVVTVGTANGEIAVTRLTARGQRDASFGQGGGERIAFPGARSASGLALAIDGRGRINVGGAVDRHRHLDLAIARTKPGGRLDHSFSADGRVLTNFGYSGSGGVDYVPGPGAIALISVNGNLIAVGSVGREFFSGKIAIARYRPSGRLDPRFGGRGKVITGSPGSPGCVAASAAALLPADHFAVAGFEYGCDEQEEGYEGPPDAGAVALYER